MSKWTPGPWRVGGLFGISVLKGDAPISGDDYRTLVCEVYSSNEDTDLEAAATARLIAAAPDLYEALEECANHADGDIGDIDWSMVRAALTKARSKPMTLPGLADDLERASGGSRELDEMIARCLSRGGALLRAALRGVRALMGRTA